MYGDERMRACVDYIHSIAISKHYQQTQLILVTYTKWGEWLVQG